MNQKSQTRYVLWTIVCAGAVLLQPAIGHLLYGASRRSLGSCESALDLFGRARLPRVVRVRGDVLGDSCRDLLNRFERTRQTPFN